jgi:hypothetical protein
MSIGWGAGSVRARLMLTERRLGAARARELAGCPALHEAVTQLTDGPYGRGMRVELDLGEAQRVIADTTLLNLRILAAWLPRDGLQLLRTLAAWFELANLDQRISYLLGGRPERPFDLGSLAVAWPAAVRAQSSEELRRVLAATQWSAPGDSRDDDLRLSLRLGWARRVLREVPEARSWAAGALAILAARELFVWGHVPDTALSNTTNALGATWSRAGTLAAFHAALPPQAAWPLAAVERPEDLWRAEAAWWTRVEKDASLLAASSIANRGVVIGSIVLLGADARRVAAALGAVARRGLPGAEEAFDAII